jgi:hypothetical protein
VKLMADYGAFPLWAVADEESLSQAEAYFWTAERPPDDLSSSTVDLWAGGLAPDALPLSASLIAALQAWADDVRTAGLTELGEHSTPLAWFSCLLPLQRLDLGAWSKV